MKNTALFSMLALTLFSQCKQSNSQNSQTTKTMTTPEIQVATNKAANGNNQFAADLLKNYTNSQEQNNKNIFFSPISIYSALAMTSEGAVDKTALEIQKTLHLPENSATRHSEMDSLTMALNPTKENYKLTMANAIWAQKNYLFKPEFLKITEATYKAKAENLDFVNQPAEACKTINGWIANNTNDKIKDMIAERNITEDTHMILTNAIYFKADWAHPFEAEFTKEKDFYTAANGTLKVQMMQMQRGFAYLETETAQAIEMPFKGNELSMIIVLPKQRNTVQSIANSANWSTFSINRDNWSQVRVSLPKFKFGTKYLMKDDLIKMGMPTPFSDNADFSNIAASKELKIGQVIHQTFIEVNETGTEAAAATVVGMEAGSAPREPIIFNADHSFLFIIKHNKTGAILFVGVVNNPNE